MHNVETDPKDIKIIAGKRATKETENFCKVLSETDPM
jgi:riboflavin synthase